MRSPLFSQLARSLRIALFAERARVSTPEALERVAAAEAKRASRRAFLTGSAAVLGGAALAGCSIPVDERTGRVSSAAKPGGPGRVAVVGAGFAGLACATELHAKGVDVTLHEAADRVGGRCSSLRGFFPGQVAERGGELIDNLHKTMLGWAKEFGLGLEDLSKDPGEITYVFGGVRYAESVIVDEFRALFPAMNDDLRKSSGGPTATSYSEYDAVLDRTNLREWLQTRGAGAIVTKAIEEAYVAEYGLEIEQQSSLAWLFFMHADRRSRFQPFGVFSDERYHVVEGNDAIAQGLAGKIGDRIRFGRKLVAVKKLSNGEIELTFSEGGRAKVERADAVVLAMPFSVLRSVSLDASLGLPAWKRRAIDELVYGTNAKMMVGFDGRPWLAHESNGTSYSDYPNHQTTWETNPSLATASRGVLTDYSGGVRGAALRPAKVQDEAAKFLADLDKVWPGAAAQASRVSGKYRVHLEHWPSNPLALGSYTCNHPGYFTTIADLEATPVGNVFFAGEHTSSFYEWQGFMEGAALSGLRAASEVLAK